MPTFPFRLFALLGAFLVPTLLLGSDPARPLAAQPAGPPTSSTTRTST